MTQDWRPGYGGELRIHESAGQRPDPRHFQALEPKAEVLKVDPELSADALSLHILYCLISSNICI